MLVISKNVREASKLGRKGIPYANNPQKFKEASKKAYANNPQNAWLYQEFPKENLCTVWLVIFVGLIFRGLGSSDDFVGLYFHDVPPLIT